MIERPSPEMLEEARRTFDETWYLAVARRALAGAPRPAQARVGGSGRLTREDAEDIQYIRQDQVGQGEVVSARGPDT
jgi:hypothetical protein